MVTGPDTSREAAITGSASFLLPAGRISPWMGRPPSTVNWSPGGGSTKTAMSPCYPENVAGQVNNLAAARTGRRDEEPGRRLPDSRAEPGPKPRA